jgi:hypothetical protein
MLTTFVLSELATRDRVEFTIDTGLTYDPVTPVRVHVSKRDRRYGVTDHGAAVAAAGVDGNRVALPDRIAIGEYDVNVSRHGIVFLSAVQPTEDWLFAICELVARGSIAVYEQLLDAALDD